MTASTVTSIKKYVQLKNASSGSSIRLSKLKLGNRRSPDHRQTDLQMGIDRFCSDRCDQAVGHHHHVDLQLSIQNQIALNTRHTDRSLRQIGIRIGQTEIALNEMLQPNSHYPPGSKKWASVIEKANTFSNEIELLTFLPTAVDNANRPQAVVRKTPELVDDSQNGAIRTSILRLKKAGEFIDRERHRLKTEAMSLYDEHGSTINAQVAGTISRFVAKHLNHHADCDLTGSPSPLTGYVDSSWD